ncbi:heavy metal translocating P-type ATPase [Lapidilactobacillus mulanensis]|uniref:Cd(2+)-exporting ATPase n=1 Tax=Lapidilactobacillus mulanensis TaxID=2485999 RepID=A0ABW4DKT4_9LACO|nr:heavy metal translocating P-type ATPase [Lapidilactobacillus mulanensis]
MGHQQKFLSVIGVGIVALLTEFLFHQPLIAQLIVTVVGAILALSMFVEMIKTLRSGKYGVDLLAIMSITATLAVGEYWASLMILVMLTGGDSLEDYAANKAGSDLKSLLDNSPQIAHIKHGDNLIDTNIDDVHIDEIAVIKPGESVPVDGIVVEGSGQFDESSMTGESRLISKKPGSELLSGTVNSDTPITMRVTKTAADSQYQTIVKLVKASQDKPAHFVRMADRYAVPFTAVSLLIAGIAWLVSGDPHRFAEVLVVASPCPLILAAPVALVSGMSRASRNSIIVKSGTSIEKLARAKTAFFDKTGTITAGRLNVTQVEPAKAFTKAQLIDLVGSLEIQSAHIFARAIVRFANDQPDFHNQPVSNFSESTGSGVVGQVAKHIVEAGRRDFVGVETPAVELAEGESIVYVAVDGEYAGYLTFADQLRPETAATMKNLQAYGIEQIAMLTGDKQATAEHIAAQVGIKDVHAECLPQTKIDLITKAPAKQRPLIMVGDGVNDAPALAAADIGIAMGARGASAASESADAVILTDDLSKVATAVKLSQETMGVAKHAVLIGIFICVGLMLIASFGVIPALFGAMLQEVVDTASILWALRARKSHEKLNKGTKNKAELVA